ncbi:MAG: virulence RhuM family protein [Sulfuricurvum sp.]|nr:virulence RhuM family protein [Sulfuricurvum sp.]
MKPTAEIIIYDSAEARVEMRIERENIWLSLQQLAELFGRDKSVISRHLCGIFASGELDWEATVAKNATTAIDGKTYQVEYYNLDAIISVGYWVNSTCATRVLREHLTRAAWIGRSCKDM